MPLETSAENPTSVRTIARLLADWIGRLGAQWIDGQVAEYRPRPGARLHYFVLRDTDADMSLSVKADVSVLGRLDPPLAEGQRVVVHARPDFYPGRGSLAMLAKEIRPVGIGALLAELERLKALLASEGLFAPERKKPLPFIPNRIGLICGRASAAMEDVLVNARERWPAIEFETREVPVQGVQAVPSVVAALKELDAMTDVDVIIVTRGGGSVEDLLPFSNETLVRAVDACVTPVVSAIGHEQDAPLIDFVADLRRRGRVVMGHQIDRERQQLDHGRQRARAVLLGRLDAATSDVTHLAARVRALSPAATLERGYAIVLTGEGAIVRDADLVPAGADLDIRVSHGRLRARRTDSPEV
jgi:exodeoxyribonuclease VII large subunit